MKYIIRFFIVIFLCVFCSFSDAHRICICFHGQGEKTILDPSIKDLPEVKKILSSVKDITGIDIENDLDGQLLPQSKSQVALITIEVSILELLKERNILNKCCLYMGQSIGNYAAAYAAGVLDLESLIKVIWTRGKLTQNFIEQDSEKYSMLAIHEKIDADILPKGIYFAGKHTPEFYTICGPQNVVSSLKVSLDKKGSKSERIPVAAPFHTPYIESLGHLLQPCYNAIHWNDPYTKLISDFRFNGSDKANNVFTSGIQVRDKLLYEQLINPMEWNNIGEILENEGITHVLIVGPGKGMKSIIEKNCLELIKLKGLKILTVTNLSEINDVLASIS